MEIKTPMVAEQLGVSPKVVMRIVQQLELTLQKNKNGHYVFSQEQVQQIENYCKTSNSNQTVDKVKQGAVSREELQSLMNLIQLLDKRIGRTEDRMHEKADDVVNYQLLQHRSEIEELQKHIIQLENQIATLEEPKVFGKEIQQLQTEKPKRKKLILSLFGF
ncbi:chromosome segregation protein [Ectobacillus polymachus]|uniref:chromosome segregation protein n=1 Tax=Ectobacillus polymachus TaxID=1508806 RepID=UPI003A85C179